MIWNNIEKNNYNKIRVKVYHRAEIMHWLRNNWMDGLYLVPLYQQRLRNQVNNLINKEEVHICNKMRRIMANHQWTHIVKGHINKCRKWILIKLVMEVLQWLKIHIIKTQDKIRICMDKMVKIVSWKNDMKIY